MPSFFEMGFGVKKMRKNEKSLPEYICDDRPRPIPPEIAKLSEEELEAKYRKIFGSIDKQAERSAVYEETE